MFKLIVGEEKLHIKYGLVGGILEDEKSPFGAYVGAKDLNSICLSMEYAIRSFIKTMKEYDTTTEDRQIELLVMACLGFAMKKEEENRKEDNLTLDEYKTINEMVDRFILSLDKELK